MGALAGPRATGRLLHHDEQSRAYAAPRRALKPVSWLHDAGPVLDQGWLNGCTGWTAADFLNSPIAAANRARFWAALPNGGPKGRRYLGDAQGRYLYELATQYDPFRWTFPPQDDGSSGLGAAKGLQKLGAIDTYRWTFDFGQALAWSQLQPTMLGILWTEPMSDPDAKGIIHIGTDRQIKAAEDSGMGHEILLRGCRWDRKLARIRNHWTEDWGLKGDALIPVDELERLVIEHQGDVCVPEVAAR